MDLAASSRAERRAIWGRSGTACVHLAAIAVAAIALVAACAVENGDSGDSPGTSGTENPQSDVTDGESNESPLVVYVYAEDGTERTYYEEFRDAFELDTLIDVDLEVRLP